jgi:hypothetical protein
MKLSRSKLLQIIREEAAAELKPHEEINTSPAPEGYNPKDTSMARQAQQEFADYVVPNVGGAAAAQAALNKWYPMLQNKYGSKLIKKLLKVGGLGILGDLIGNLSVAPIAKGMGKVRDVTGTEPIWPEEWKLTPAEKQSQRQEQGDVLWGEDAWQARDWLEGGIGFDRDIDFERALPTGPLQRDLMAAATDWDPGSNLSADRNLAAAKEAWRAQREAALAQSWPEPEPDWRAPIEPPYEIASIDDEGVLATRKGEPYPINPAPQNPLDRTDPVYGRPGRPPTSLPKRPSEGVPYLGPVKIERPDLAESVLARWQKIIKS